MEDYVERRIQDIRDYTHLWLKRCVVRLELDRVNVSRISKATKLEADTIKRIVKDGSVMSTLCLKKATRFIGDNIDDVVPEINGIARMLIELEEHHVNKGIMYCDMQQIMGYASPNISTIVKNFDGDGFYRPPLQTDVMLMYYVRLSGIMEEVRKRASEIEVEDIPQEEKPKRRRIVTPDRDKYIKPSGEQTEWIEDEDLTGEAVKMAKQYLYDLGARNIRQIGSRRFVGYTDPTYEAKLTMINNRWGHLIMKVIHTGDISIDRRVDMWSR